MKKMMKEDIVGERRELKGFKIESSKKGTGDGVGEEERYPTKSTFFLSRSCKRRNGRRDRTAVAENGVKVAKPRGGGGRGGGGSGHGDGVPDGDGGGGGDGRELGRL
ncbi:hypothetical protein TIFTF001_012362 [Ficus carica]|uniref:Uncharacterized protein n=1 Tax=Ficus carica TaxID=3494 RepID=A0AA88A1K1_FICCA|nr:hypothetical protein TIFTF001_012362 [Ficus carica]